MLVGVANIIRLRMIMPEYVRDLLHLLLSVSERAANIARFVREEKELFGILVEEKESDKFQHDYKTLADVLIQATVKYYISQEFPSMKDRVSGEESSHFTNKLGEDVSIEIDDSLDNTAKQLSVALDGRANLAKRLAALVHSDIKLNTDKGAIEELGTLEIDTNQLGIWIDPIDGTNEYVKGTATKDVHGIHPGGLQVSIVLMGVYNICTGEPVIGVLNQPFCSKDEHGRWNGRVVWGVASEGFKLACVPRPERYHRDPSHAKICLCSSVDHFTSHDWEVRHVSGCGYKLLCVIDGLADVFALTQDSSYKWDTCGPQAILRALGGDIISWKRLAEERKEVPILYNRADDPASEGSKRWSNQGGIIGYLKLDRIETLVKTNT